MSHTRIQPGDDLFDEIDPQIDQPSLTGSASVDDTDDLPPVDGSAEATVIRGISAAAVAMLMLAWSLLGLILWIPMLVAAVIDFSLAVAGVSLSGKRAAGAGKALNRALPFYFQVFHNIREAVHADESSASQPVRHRMNRRQITLHVVRATVFWGLVISIALWMSGHFD